MLQLMSSSVSHEMITPLKCIIQMVNGLKDQQLHTALNFDADLVVNTAKMLLNQVKGNLDKNLLSQNLFEPQLECHDLSSVVTQTLDLLTLQAKVIGISTKFVDLSEPTQVLVDKLRVQQIVINLIQNAVKFSKRDDTIEVTLS